MSGNHFDARLPSHLLNFIPQLGFRIITAVGTVIGHFSHIYYLLVLFFLSFLHPRPNLPVRPLRQPSQQTGRPRLQTAALGTRLRHGQGGRHILHVGCLETLAATGALKCLDASIHIFRFYCSKLQHPATRVKFIMVHIYLFNSRRTEHGERKRIFAGNNR